MAEAILAALGDVLTRWAMGTPAASAVPAAWRDAIGAEPREAELRLLALTGQFLDTAVTAAPQGELHTPRQLPVLALPTLPFSLRPLARDFLKYRYSRYDLLHFLAARGWTMHPEDWMPSAGDEDAPEVYSPWRDWAQPAVSGRRVRKSAGGGLTGTNWYTYDPEEREVALAKLRQHDPDAARAILEEKFARENDEVRFYLLRVLAQRLSKADAPFLEGIAAADPDVSVKALAASLLARLGRGSATGAVIDELVGFFELRRTGLLRHRRVVVPRPIEGSSQRTRRSTLFADADFTAFAGALGLAPIAVVEAWSWGADVQADVGLAAMASRSGADEVVTAITGALAEHAVGNLPPLFALVPRLDGVWRSRLAQQVLRNGGSFLEAFEIGGVGCRINEVIRMPAGVALLDAVAIDPAMWADGKIERVRLLGLIASRTAARQALESLVAAGLRQEDLGMIRLNAALDDNGGQG